MKNKILFILLVLFMIPRSVFAQDIFFLTYPDGHEEGIDNYTESMKEEEKLLYLGKTDSNGQVQLNNWEEVGDIRIEYLSKSANTNLSQRWIELIDEEEKTIVNPPTGQYLLLVIILVLSIISVLLLPKKKEAKFIIVPIMVLVFITQSVKADSENTTIVIKDKNHNVMSNVEVKIYGKPLKVEQAPAVKLDANGGYYLGDVTEVYLRLPRDGCTLDEFRDSLTALEILMIMPYREGYYSDGYEGYPEYIHNGDVLKERWEELEGSSVLTYKANGGSLVLNGKIITEYKTNGGIPIGLSIPTLFNNNSYLVGMDDNEACSHFNQYGVIDKTLYDSEMPNIVYFCWNDHPDGIYINEEQHLFVGDNTRCFNNSTIYPTGNIETFDVSFQTVLIISYNEEKGSMFSLTNVLSPITATIPDPGNNTFFRIADINNTEIHELKIVKNGQTLVTLESSDLTLHNFL